MSSTSRLAKRLIRSVIEKHGPLTRHQLSIQLLLRGTKDIRVQDEADSNGVSVGVVVTRVRNWAFNADNLRTVGDTEYCVHDDTIRAVYRAQQAPCPPCSPKPAAITVRVRAGDTVVIERY